MSKSTISTFQLFALIPDAETARHFQIGGTTQRRGSYLHSCQRQRRKP